MKGCLEEEIYEIPHTQGDAPTFFGRRNEGKEPDLDADGGANGVGEGLAEAMDVGVVLGFDHDAGELLGTGVAKHHAAAFAERGLGFGEGARDFGERFERRF